MFVVVEQLRVAECRNFATGVLTDNLSVDSARLVAFIVTTKSNQPRKSYGGWLLHFERPRAAFRSADFSQWMVPSSSSLQQLGLP